MRSCAQFAFGTSSLKGLTIALQGLGSVSYYLLEYLAEEGAKVVGCDIDQAAIDRAVKKYGVEVVRPEAIYDVPCDIFAPSALGASINPETLPRLKTKVVAGAANNQLSTQVMGEELLKRGIVYAPDYVINGGGVINIYHEGMVAGGYDKGRAFEHVAKIGATMTEILNRAKAEKLPTHLIADKIAEERIERARSARR
jgi:leucine dehydrogenase